MNIQGATVYMVVDAAYNYREALALFATEAEAQAHIAELTAGMDPDYPDKPMVVACVIGQTINMVRFDE